MLFPQGAPRGAPVRVCGEGPCVLVVRDSVRGVMRRCVRSLAFCVIVNRSVTEDMGAKAGQPMTDCVKAPFVDGGVTDLTFKKSFTASAQFVLRSV